MNVAGLEIVGLSKSTIIYNVQVGNLSEPFEWIAIRFFFTVLSLFPFFLKENKIYHIIEMLCINIKNARQKYIFTTFAVSTKAMNPHKYLKIRTHKSNDISQS